MTLCRTKMQRCRKDELGQVHWWTERCEREATHGVYCGKHSGAEARELLATWKRNAQKRKEEAQ